MNLETTDNLAFALPRQDIAMSPSLRWLRREIQRYEQDRFPVQNILQVSFASNKEVPDKEKMQRDVCDELSHVLQNVHIRGVQLNFICHETTAPVHYYTRSVYSDIVKARALKYFFAQFNERHAHQGTITFLLSRPLDYLANAEANEEQAIRQQLEQRIAELEQRLQRDKGVGDAQVEAVAAPVNTLQAGVADLKGSTKSSGENQLSTEHAPEAIQSPKRAK